MDRERKLDSALLQCGKYKDALMSQLQWLTDMEKTVRDLAPVSSDYKYLKSQLQEQKYIERMVNDRSGGIEAVMAIGQELQDQIDPAEKQQVKETMTELKGRWDTLQEDVNSRHTALDAALAVAKDFYEKEGPFVEWLEKTEKKVREIKKNQ